jgi:hypothetical protein
MACKVCRHMDSAALDKFLVLPSDYPGKRGPRSLAPTFGLDRRDLRRHAKQCLVGERRERVIADLARLAGLGSSSQGDGE